MISSDSSGNPKPPRLRPRTAVAGLALILLASLVFTSAINLRQFQNVYRSKVENELMAVIERHSFIVDSFIDDRLSDVRVIAREHPFDRLSHSDFLRRVLNLMR